MELPVLQAPAYAMLIPVTKANTAVYEYGFGGCRHMDKIRSSILRSITLSLVFVSLGSILLGEAFTHAFNVMLDESTLGRIFFTFRKPLIFALASVMIVIMVFSLRAILNPLYRYIASPRDAGEALYTRARKAALGVPGTLIAITVFFWIIGTLVFFALNGWKAPGGTPLAWVLAFKITEGFLSATLNALIINRSLFDAKRLLGIERIRKDERDFFAELRELLAVIAATVALIVHLAYIGRFFMMKDSAAAGPSNLVLSFSVVGIVIGSVAASIIWLSRKENAYQTRLLRKRLLGLAGLDKVDLSARAEILNFDDTGFISDAFNAFAESLKKMVGEIGESKVVLQRSGEVLVSGVEDMQSVFDGIAKSVDRIGEHVQNESASMVESNASILAMGKSIEKLRSAIDEQASSVTESGASIEEMIFNIKSMATNVEQVGSSYSGLTEAADEGKRRIAETNGIIAKVAEMSNLLLDANVVISGISAQTNLLAMNAAIEAAHAGSAGAGFSVVADEIRLLAEKSQRQSKEVGKRLKEINASTDTAVKSAEAASRGFDEVVSLIQTVSRFQDEIRSALREQSSGSSQILDALGAMNGVTESVRAGAGDMSSGAGELSTGMERLATLTLRTKEEMDRISSEMARMSTAFERMVAMIAENSGAVDRVGSQIDRFGV